MGVLMVVVDGQVLSLTLRVVFNMFNSVREHMKVQGYLAHERTPITRTLGMGLRSGPRGVHFLVSEVPLYPTSTSGVEWVSWCTCAFL